MSTGLMFAEASSMVTDNASKLVEALRNEKKKTEGGKYINMSGKTGEYKKGEEKHHARLPGFYVVDPSTAAVGVTCWKNNTRVDGVMQPAYVSTPVNYDPQRHGPFGDGEGWSDSRGFIVLDLANGEPYAFSTSNTSGNRTTGALFGEMADKIDEAGGLMYPVIRFTSSTFQANAGGKMQTNYRPEFEIYAWLDQEAAVELATLTENRLTYVKRTAVLEEGMAWPAKKKKAVAGAASGPKRKRRTIA